MLMITLLVSAVNWNASDIYFSNKGGNRKMTLLKSITINPLKAHTSTIIFLHGLGDTGDGWSSIASVFSPQLPNTKFIFPHSPHKPVTLNGGMMMPAWYDIKSLGGQSNSMLEDKTGMYDSVAQIMELVENEMHIGISSSRIICI